MHTVYIGDSFNSNLGQKLIIKSGKYSFRHPQREEVDGGWRSRKRLNPNLTEKREMTNRFL